MTKVLKCLRNIINPYEFDIRFLKTLYYLLQFCALADYFTRTHAFAYKLCFPCSNDEAEYETLVVGLKAAKRLGIKKLKVFGNSELVIKQIEGAYEVKNPSLAVYRATSQELMKQPDLIKSGLCFPKDWQKHLLKAMT